MSEYHGKKDFLLRSRKLLDDLSIQTDKEWTLFLNLCMGLLVAPQQWGDNDPSLAINGQVDFSWGIDISKIKIGLITTRKGSDPLSVENFAYHIRNCFCHNLFVINNVGGVMDNVLIEDYSRGTLKTFELYLSLTDLKTFVLKYYEEKIKLLK